MLKQVILVRIDLKMPKGKLATQCAHAAVDSVLLSEKEKINEWKKQGSKKVVLRVNDEKELLRCFNIAKSAKLKTVVVKDAGKTFFKKPTITCIGIGPDIESKIDKVAGKLKMF